MRCQTHLPSTREGRGRLRCAQMVSRETSARARWSARHPASLPHTSQPPSQRWMGARSVKQVSTFNQCSKFLQDCVGHSPFSALAINPLAARQGNTTEAWPHTRAKTRDLTVDHLRGTHCVGVTTHLLRLVGAHNKTTKRHLPIIGKLRAPLTSGLSEPGRCLPGCS
jgi:hypothetical protein